MEGSCLKEHLMLKWYITENFSLKVLKLVVLTYRVSSFKHRSVYLILRLLGAAFIRERRLFQKSK